MHSKQRRTTTQASRRRHGRATFSIYQAEDRIYRHEEKARRDCLKRLPTDIAEALEVLRNVSFADQWNGVEWRGVTLQVHALANETPWDHKYNKQNLDAHRLYVRSLCSRLARHPQLEPIHGEEMWQIGIELARMYNALHAYLVALDKEATAKQEKEKVL